MVFLIKAAQLILSLSIIVVLHEMGHFLAAKYFKTRVEKFYLFFNPWFSLYKKQIGETEYGLGWLPLGGYVKISGMVDESMDKDQMSKPAEEWEFRAKPAWQRLIIITGGVAVNLALGMFIYAMIMFTWGSEKLPVQNAVFGYRVDSVLMDLGFKDGDIPIRFGDDKPEYYSDLAKTLILSDNAEVEVIRDGNDITFNMPEGWRDRVLDENKRGLFSPILPFVADTILPSGTAINSDLQKGDRIIGINDISTPWFYSFANEIGEFKGQTIQLDVIRNNDTLQFPVEVSKKGKIGVGPGSPSNYFVPETIHYTFFQSIPAGIKHGYNTLTSYASSLRLLFTKSGAKQMGGFGTIGNLFPATWDWQTFWNLTAFISIILAFMNILPIPALDGGHAVFILYEMATGRTPNQKVLEYAQMIGMFLLLGLVLFANINDIYKYFFQ
jgi:regulator of sigma E protease